MIKTMDPTISPGVGHDQRIGTQVKCRRVMMQYVLRWPLLSLTPNWNGVNTTATNNDGLFSKDWRSTLEGRIYLVRLNHADQGYAAFSKYLAAFKRPYTLRENMSEAQKEFKK